MPELPDIAAYITALEPRPFGRNRSKASGVASPFLLCAPHQPPLASVEGRKVEKSAEESASESQSGVEGDLWLVFTSDDCRPIAPGALGE